MPAVRLEFSKPFEYAGGHSFILYEVANAEQHFLLMLTKTDALNGCTGFSLKVYLPSNTHTYDYASPKTVNLAARFLR
jgi:hypothetical protein